VLARALRDAEAIGAGWLREQAREELTVAGGRRRRDGGSSAGLTGQEQRVARLAATGATNREIARSLSLSVKTIEFHLQRIYTKLGIASRRQLIAMTGHAEAGALPWQELVAGARPSVVEPPGLAGEQHSLN
ncbi:MAG: helix-turn-helix domain-containing protein, partial [Actinomadura sp.]